MIIKNKLKKIIKYKNKLFNFPNYFRYTHLKYDLKPYNNLFIKDDKHNWVLKSISKEMKYIITNLKINLIDSKYNDFITNQCEFNLSKFDALLNFDKYDKNKKSFAYFHGLPSTHPLNKECIKSLKKNHKYFSKVQITNDKIKNLLLETGIDKEKLHKILISIDFDLFNKNYSKQFKNSFRIKNQIPLNAFVIGSFQKDGEKWNSGNKPKYSKGPDIFINAVKVIRQKIPETFVLLSGPSRGYMINELEKANIPYRYINLIDYSKIPELYSILNIYIVSSREEGGPRAILESMSSGVPIISSKVGQAEELIKNNYNGWLTEIGDIEDILDKTLKVYFGNIHENFLINAKQTAINNSYKNQIENWKLFFKDFIN